LSILLTHTQFQGSMAPLEKAYFAGQDATPDEDVRRAEVANFTTGPAEALRRFGGRGHWPAV
jgi:hypothetical protein